MAHEPTTRSRVTDQATAAESLELDVPTWDGGLAIRYGLPTWRDVQRLRRLEPPAGSSDEDRAVWAARWLAKTFRVFIVYDGWGQPAELLDENGEPKGLATVADQLSPGMPAGEAVLALFGGASRLLVHAQEVTDWAEPFMQAAADEVMRGLEVPHG